MSIGRIEEVISNIEILALRELVATLQYRVEIHMANIPTDYSAQNPTQPAAKIYYKKDSFHSNKHRHPFQIYFCQGICQLNQHPDCHSRA